MLFLKHLMTSQIYEESRMKSNLYSTVVSTDLKSRAKQFRRNLINYAQEAETFLSFSFAIHCILIIEAGIEISLGKSFKTF